MIVKTTTGETREIPVGGALCGMGLTEITFTVKDVMEIRRWPGFGEWFADIATMRLVAKKED